MSDEKKRIIGFGAVVAEFGGEVPSKQELDSYTVIEDGKREREIVDITKAVVFKRGDCFLLFSQETGVEFQKMLDDTRERAASFTIEGAFESYQKRSAAKEADDRRINAYRRLQTWNFHDPDSVWTHMENLVKLPIAEYKPVAGELWDAEKRLSTCATLAQEFEPAYAAALAAESPAPSDRKVFMAWEEQFRATCKSSKTRVPFVAGLRLVTRSFGSAGTFGCFVLEGDVDLFKEIHGIRRTKDGSPMKDRDGNAITIMYFHSDAFLGILRWKYAFLAMEEARISERKQEDESREEKFREKLGGFVTDDTLRGFLGEKERNGLKKLRARDKDNRRRSNRDQRAENGR